jgi:hypothetical protein
MLQYQNVTVAQGMKMVTIATVQGCRNNAVSNPVLYTIMRANTTSLRVKTQRLYCIKIVLSLN